jgi:ribosomal protein S18 acetylase RimI-like enzyme
MPIAPAELDFKAATLDDVDTLLPLMRLYYEFDYLAFEEERAQRALAGLLENDSLGKAWLIRWQEAAAGYVVLTYDYGLDSGGREAVIDEFYLRSDYRRQGIGREAIRFLEQFCSAEGMTALWLGVRHDNTAARAFYSEMGFEDTGLRMMAKAIQPLVNNLKTP